MSTLPRAELFWSTGRVASAIDDPKVRIVDCRFSFDEDMRARYVDGHLPGAVYVNWAEDLSAAPPESGHPRWMLQSAEEFARTMARLGIGDDTMVVGYDAEGGHHAARLWLALRRFGHDRMAVMEGGIHKWIAEGRPLETGARTPDKAAVFTPRLRTGVIATWCFIFIGVMRELSAAIVLFTSQTKVISVLIYDLNESGDLAAIAVLGIAMLVITFAVVLAVNRIPMFGANAGTRLRNS